MAMIPCPGCGEMISDKSPKCIHCGYELTPQIRTCPECGTELEQTATVCPKCGCPLSSKSSTSDPIEVTVSKNAKKNKKKIAIAIVAVIAIVVIGVVGINQHYFDYFEEAPYILTMNRIIVIHSLSLIRFRRFRATPILKKLTGSLRQDFRWRVHDN